MSNFIITGGLGFIGSHLCEYLYNLNSKNKIIVIDNLYSGIYENISKYLIDKITIINDDIRNKSIEKYISENDIVIHLAAISSLPECQSNPQLAFDINVTGTLNILEISRLKNVKKIIFASTSAIYENNITFPCNENDNVNPSLIYSLSKYTAEKLCLSYIKNYNLDIRIIRFFNVYGGNQDYRRLSPPLTIYILNELVNNRQPILHSDGLQKRDYVYIDDLLDLIYRIIDKNTITNKIINACSGEIISVNDIFKLFQKYLKTDIKPIYNDPTKFWNNYPNLLNEPNSLNKNIIKEEVVKFTSGSNKIAFNELNWKPYTNMEQGIQKIISLYYTKNSKP